MAWYLLTVTVVEENVNKGNESQTSDREGSTSRKVIESNSSYVSDDMAHEISGIKDSLLADLKVLKKNCTKTETHDVACQSNSLYLTPIVRSLFNANHSPNKVESTLEGFNLNTNVSPTKEGETKDLSLENNLFLRAIASKIDNIAIRVGHNTGSMNELGTIVRQVERQSESLSARIDENAKTCADLDQAVIKVYAYTDSKITNLREAIPLTLSEMGGDIEKRVESQNNVLLTKIKEEMGKRLFEGVMTGELGEAFREKLTEFENQTNVRLGRIEENQAGVADKLAEIDGLRNEMALMKEQNERSEVAYNTQIKDLHCRLSEAIETLNALKIDNGNFEGPGYISRNEWRQQKHRIDEAHERISSMEMSVDTCVKKADSVDLVMRKSNIIIDQLSEHDGEDLFARLMGIFSNTLRWEDLSQVKIVRVFRLGVKRVGGPPRKVLLELDCPISRDFLLANARLITKSGNDGKPYYLNDDIPEELRRWKTDVQKYMRYMEKKGHRIEKVGEDMMIDGRRWRMSDLNNLPEGQRFMDSRTISQNGRVAFQSSVSPLSNLYHCQLRIDGQIFKSTEHAYNYLKCTHHGLTQLAQDVKQQPTSYKAMNLGKGVTENAEWLNKRIEVMERLVKSKVEQVPIFRDTLKKTTNSRLVENSWSHFWGSGCNFLADVVWDGTYKGQNQFGRLLERVRDSS